MLIVLGFVAGAVGCGGKICRINGSVTRGGEPLEWKADGGYLLVIFIPKNRKADRNVYRAETNRDTGEYHIDKISAGSYLVAIQQFDDRHNDALRHVYNPGATNLEREVTEEGQVIDLDLPSVLPRLERR